MFLRTGMAMLSTFAIAAWPAVAFAQPTKQIGPATLESRYRTIWSSVGGPLPGFLLHVGASAGNKTGLWAKLPREHGDGPRVWSHSCSGTERSVLREEIYDQRFGVALLSIELGGATADSIVCKVSLGRESAYAVLSPAVQSTEADRFSFLAFSCNEPFSTSHTSNGNVGIFARDISLWLRMTARARGEDSRGQLPFRPSFVLGLGDQVYVDPDPKETAPLSFFTGIRSDKFLVKNDVDSLYAALETVYRFNFGLPPVDSAFSRLPSHMMWDDHEIRDGWGSQRDESDSDMASYFRVARHAFIAHQMIRSSPPGLLTQVGYDSLVAGNGSLHHQFDHGDRSHFLMLDSRSTRGRGSIFDAEAESAVRRWLSKGDVSRGDLFVLTVGVPLFPTRRISKIRGELEDDLRDGWDSKENAASRAALLQLLEQHFTRYRNDRLLVLSGDVHYSSLFFISIGGRVIGQEIVTSGIAHSIPSRLQQVNWLVDVAGRVGSFSVTPAGKINTSASFAEVVVSLSRPNSAPAVELVFHANGTKVNGPFILSPVRLANTGLLRPQSKPLWYFPYAYDYKDEFAHLKEAKIRPDLVAAGTILDLALSLPKLKSRRSTIYSAVQAQSVFCVVNDSDYGKTFAESWTLEEITPKCSSLVPKR